jgi:hypothetical protein
MMVPEGLPDSIFDPVETLKEVLEHTWKSLCHAYDVVAEIPPMRPVFGGADLTRPEDAAEIVLANMLLEVIECLGRFSPWYTLPARAFGLMSYRDFESQETRWRLAPEAIHKWRTTLLPLTAAIRHNSGLIQAVFLVDDLMVDSHQEEACALASCDCDPPRLIQIQPSILEQAGIRCDCCERPFLLVADDGGRASRRSL